MILNKFWLLIGSFFTFWQIWNQHGEGDSLVFPWKLHVTKKQIIIPFWRPRSCTAILVMCDPLLEVNLSSVISRWFLDNQLCFLKSYLMKKITVKILNSWVVSRTSFKFFSWREWPKRPPWGRSRCLCPFGGWFLLSLSVEKI